MPKLYSITTMVVTVVYVVYAVLMLGWRVSWSSDPISAVHQNLTAVMNWALATSIYIAIIIVILCFSIMRARGRPDKMSG